MRTLAFWCMALAACGESIEGEDVGPGTLVLHYGSEAPKLAVGAAIDSTSTPGEMLVMFGTNHVDCDTDIENDFPGNGTYLYFSVPKAAGTYASTYTDILKVTSRSLHSNGTSSGNVTIDSVEGRVTGSLTVMTTDDDVGTLSAEGTFDVVRCF